MAPSQPKGFNRRELLGSAAGVVAAGIVPGLEKARGADPAVTLAKSTVGEAPVLNVCSTTARRIAEIAARNRIREEAGLPLLSVPRELRRMKNAADATEFEAFTARYRTAVWDEVLMPERARRGQADWRPTSFMEGLRFQSEVSRILRQRFHIASSRSN